MSIFTYLKIGVLVASLAVGASGAWYIQGIRLDKLRADNQQLTRQLDGYRNAMRVLREDMKIDRENQDEKDRIDALGPDDLVDEFKRLRERARNGKGAPAGPPNAGNK